MEVWGGSYDVDFHCDFFLINLEVQEYTSFVGIYNFFTKFLGKKSYVALSVLF
jgi:hypothetical protein